MKQWKQIPNFSKEKVVLAISMANNGMSEKDILQMLNL